MRKEDFNKVWKDTSREGILNQFYYEHYELLKCQVVIDKAMKELDKIIYDLEEFPEEATPPSKEELCKIFGILKGVSE